MPGVQHEPPTLAPQVGVTGAHEMPRYCIVPPSGAPTATGLPALAPTALMWKICFAVV
jgi:hypothetical protein